MLIFGFLPACATVKRGGSDTVVFTSIPPGAHIETSVVIGSEPRFSQVEYNRIKRGEAKPPKLTFFACPKTPCTLDVPRKRNFEVLVSKDGYVSQRHYIDFVHRKDLAKQTQLQTIAGTTILGAGAGAMGASAVAGMTSVFSLGTATATTGTLAAGAAIFALPVVAVGAASLGIDSSTGANYDYWPNPAMAALEPSTRQGQNAENAAMKAQFLADRRKAILHPRLMKTERIAQKRADKAERIARLQSKGFYVGVPIPETLKEAIPLEGQNPKVNSETISEKISEKKPES